MQTKTTQLDKAIEVFNKNDGILRTSQVLSEGIHRRTLYGMRDSGLITKVSRGVYRLTDRPELGNPDLITVATRIPNGVICLISALVFHELTTQIPRRVDIALRPGTKAPRLEDLPIKTYRFSGESFSSGIDTHILDGVNVRLYNPEKTIADCFKFRNQIGLDTVLEAVRFYRDRKPVKPDELMHFATICRVTKVMKPYLEAILR